MKRSRILPAVLAGACLLSLAACDDAEPAPGPGPAAAASSAPAAAAPAVDDKTLCKTVNTAGSTMKTNISNAQREDGSVPAADVKKIFSEFHTDVTKALGEGGDSEVATAARAVAGEIATAAKAADPISTAAESDFEKLSADLTTACQTAGVKINF